MGGHTRLPNSSDGALRCLLQDEEIPDRAYALASATPQRWFRLGGGGGGMPQATEYVLEPEMNRRTSAGLSGTGSDGDPVAYVVTLEERVSGRVGSCSQAARVQADLQGLPGALACHHEEPCGQAGFAAPPRVQCMCVRYEPPGAGPETLKKPVPEEHGLEEDAVIVRVSGDGRGGLATTLRDSAGLSDTSCGGECACFEWPPGDAHSLGLSAWCRFVRCGRGGYGVVCKDGGGPPANVLESALSDLLRSARSGSWGEH